MLLNTKESKVLEEFADDFHKRIYGRALAKKTGMNQKTVANVLNKLEKNGIVRYKFEGKNKTYSLNKLNPHIKEIIKIIEIHRKLTFLNQNKKLLNLFDQLEQSVEGILVIFGSYASNTKTSKSDLDIFVLGKSPSVENLEKTFNIEINLIKSSKKKFNKKEQFIEEVIKNHIVLKGVDEFVNLIW
ncbi:MAG: nucleotidyltransferase domain-containing protein [archaeon]